MSKEKVLIIEDDKDIREGVRILLESENYRVQEAENGRQGLELLDQRGCSNYRIDCVMWFRPVSALALYGDIERICIGIRIVICI